MLTLKNLDSFSLTKNFESLCQNDSYFAVLKDTQFKFLYCNKKFADSINMKKAEQTIGLTDYDMPWTREQTNLYRQDDQNVIKYGIPKLHYTERQKQYDGSEKTIVVSKYPVYYKCSKIIGVLVIYTRKEINNVINGCHFSKREIQCLELLIRGKTAKEIGKVLNLSTRTIESYIKNIKQKTQITTKSDLIEKFVL